VPDAPAGTGIDDGPVDGETGQDGTVRVKPVKRVGIIRPCLDAESLIAEIDEASPGGEAALCDLGGDLHRGLMPPGAALPDGKPFFRDLNGEIAVDGLHLRDGDQDDGLPIGDHEIEKPEVFVPVRRIALPPAGDGPILAALRIGLGEKILSVAVVPEMNLQGSAFEVVQVDDVDQLVGGKSLGGTPALQEVFSENPGRQGRGIPAAVFRRCFRRYDRSGFRSRVAMALMKSGSSEWSICKVCPR
jgi:hypothetical protein